MLLDGAFKPGPGICGVGVYGFSCDHHLETDELGASWGRTVTGGYNGGCIIVCKPRGVLIKGLRSDEVVPPGATARLRDQFSTNPESLEVMTVAFHLDGLTGSIQKQLDALGSQKLSHLEVEILLLS